MFPIRTSVAPREIPGIVIALIVANLAVFVFQAGLPPGAAREFTLEFALVPAWFDAAGWTPWPVLTNIFMHGGIVHLGVNMWTLWLFGRVLEDAFGPLRFLGFYLACGVLASLAHLLFNLGSAIPALGASGAIAGVLGGFTLLHPKARITLITPILFFPIMYSLPAAAYTGLWFAFQIVPGLLEMQTGLPRVGIAWWAHIGGLAAGLGLTWLITRTRRANRPRPGRLAVSIEAGHRPRVIAVGVNRQVEPITGIQRPNVIRLGGPRKRETRRGAAPPPDLLQSDAMPAMPESRPPPKPSSKPSSSVPITDREAPRGAPPESAPDQLERDIWRRSGR